MSKSKDSVQFQQRYVNAPVIRDGVLFRRDGVPKTLTGCAFNFLVFIIVAQTVVR